MNTGCEGGETAIKIARKWGYTVKGVTPNKATMIMPKGTFWGRSITASGACDDPIRYTNFGPFTAGFKLVKYNDLKALEKMLASSSDIVGYMPEPIQGESGVIIPDEGYIKGAAELCKKYNVLFMCDEVQTGFGRTGKMMCYEHDKGPKPDMLILGKALSGGMMPVSAVLADKHIMDVIGPGDHGSTYGGNPLACAVAKRAVEVLVEDGLVENSKEVGDFMLNELKDRLGKHNLVKEIRGKGLF